MQAQSERISAGASQIRDFLQTRGFAPCDSAQDIAAFRALAQELLPVEVASIETLQSVQARSRHSLFLHSEPGNAAFLAIGALSRGGERALLANAAAPLQPEWTEPFSRFTRNGYIWGLGGETRNAQFKVLRALSAMRSLFFEHIGLYARAATSEGRRVMAGFGYDTIVDASAGLYYAPPLVAPVQAAAS